MTTNRDEEVAKILDRDVIVVANAGTGKTFLLVEHYFALLESGLDPAQLVAFTFTEKAAAELKERILRRLPLHPGFSDLPAEILQGFRAKILQGPIGTIHQFCLRILEAAAGAEGQKAFKIVDEAVEAAFQEDALRAYLRKRFEAEDPDALAFLEVYGIADLVKIFEAYLAVLPLEGESDVALPAPDREEQDLLDRLKRLADPLAESIALQKQARAWMSFADMERRALECLKKPTPALKSFLAPLRHMLVDEFQDTSPIQIRILRALRDEGTGRKKRMFCVGDPKQSIYRFRDVDRNLIAKTEEELIAEGGIKFDLLLNRRSTPRLLNLVNAFATRAFPDALPSQASRENHPAAEVVLFTLGDSEEKIDAEQAAEAEAKGVVEQLLRLEQTIPLDRMAVLYRASGSVLRLLKELQSRGIPYNMRGGQNLFQRQEIQDLHRLLYFLADPKDDISLVGVLRSPLFLLSDATLYFLCRLKPKGSLWEHLRKADTVENLIRDFPEEAQKTRWALDRLERWISLAKSRSASHFIETGLRAEYWLSLYAQGFRDPQRAMAMEQWLDWLKALEADHEFPRLERTVHLLKEVAALLPNKPPLGDLIGSTGSLSLLTIHAAKGLQFDTVFLIGLNRRPNRQYPLLQRLGNGLALKIPGEEEKRKTERYVEIERFHNEEEAEENKRLLYVALTRAENRLFVSLSPGNGNKDSLQQLLLKNLEDEGAPWRGPLPLALPTVSRERFGRELKSFISRSDLGHRGVTTVSELETFLACPLKHHLAYERLIPSRKAELSEKPGPTEIGTFLHEALHRLHSDPGQKVETAVESVLRTANPVVDPELNALLITYLNSYLEGEAHHIFDGAIEDHSELPFLLKLSQGEVRGHIDRLIRRTDGWHLLDFKFSARSASARELLEAYGFQLKTYAIAAEQMVREPLRSVQIHLLNRAQSQEFLFGAEQLATHHEMLQELLSRFFRSPEDLTAIKWRPACAQCAFHVDLSLCPVPEGRPWRA